MRSFTFSPTAEVPLSVLEAKSTFAKIRVEPIDAYVDAEIRALPGGIQWTATTSNLPQSSSVALSEHRAVLCLSKGELGRQLGSIDLGRL